MEGTSSKGVLGLLSVMEVEMRSRRNLPTPPPPQEQRSRVEELEAEAEALMKRRDQLKAEIQTHERLQKLRKSMDKQRTHQEEEEMDEDFANAQLLQLMAKHTQLTDLLQAHHLIGGYDITETRQLKGVCVSVATAYEGVYLDTYNLEIELKPALRISRHNIPPFIPLSSLAEQSVMQANITAFLDTLSLHLNAFAGRKRQLQLVKEQFKSIEVMESNVLCSILVLLFTVPREKTAVLCTLDYSDHTRCLPTSVHFECEDKELTDCPEWKTNCSLLMETPVHKALRTMQNMGFILSSNQTE